MGTPGERPLVLALAGTGYGQQAPLLWWSRAIAEQAGCEVVAPAWTVDDAAWDDPVAFVERAIDGAIAGRRPDLVVAKSFGCFALPWAVRHHVRGVWLTPVLTHDAVVAALAAAPDGHVAVGGTADAFWRPERVRASGARLQTVDGADHTLQVPGDWQGSHRLQADVLQVVADAVPTRRR